MLCPVGRGRMKMNKKIRDIAWILGMNVVFIVLLVLFAANRELADPLMSIVIPMLIVTSGALVYTIHFEGDLVIAMSAILLLEIGQMTQVLINEGVSSMPTILLFVSPVFGAVCVAVISYLGKKDLGDEKKAQKALIIVVGGVVLITLILLTIGRNINGTKAWLVLGPLSLQLTELFKPLYVLFHAVLWKSSLSHKKRFIFSTAMTLGSAGLLLIINELGTLLVILLMWIILTFIYSEKLLDTAIVLGGTLLTVLGGYGVLGLVYSRVKSKILLGEKPAGLSKKLYQIFDKLHQRVMIFTDLDQYMIEYKDEASRQPVKAREMIMNGGLFGSTRRTTIPIENSDYAYVGLILRCGIVFAIVVLVLFFIILYRSLLKSVRMDNRFESVMFTGAALGLILPTFINVMGTTNFSFMTGIAVPFISHGGTNMLLSVFNVMLLIWGTAGIRPNITLPAPAKASSEQKADTPEQEEIPFTR